VDAISDHRAGRGHLGGDVSVITCYPARGQLGFVSEQANYSMQSPCYLRALAKFVLGPAMLTNCEANRARGLNCP
jgi:hypothetical protein